MKCYDNRFDEAALIKSLQVESPEGVNLCTDCVVCYQGDTGKSGAGGFLACFRYVKQKQLHTQ